MQAAPVVLALKVPTGQGTIWVPRDWTDTPRALATKLPAVTAVHAWELPRAMLEIVRDTEEPAAVVGWLRVRIRLSIFTMVEPGVMPAPDTADPT